MASSSTPPDGFEPSTDCFEGKRDASYRIGFRGFDWAFESRGRPWVSPKWAFLETSALSVSSFETRPLEQMPPRQLIGLKLGFRQRVKRRSLALQLLLGLALVLLPCTSLAGANCSFMATKNPALRRGKAYCASIAFSMLT